MWLGKIINHNKKPVQAWDQKFSSRFANLFLSERKKTMEMITCPNCKATVTDEEIYPSFCTDSLLCCKFCKGKSKHKAIIGTDPSLVFLEMQEKRQL